MVRSKIKILVCYHKPEKLFKNDILVPIHVGRSVATQASKDGVISADDYKWMLDNMIGDDTGDNVSYLNRNFAELTAIYWAWKNYDKLGNPDYIGLSHYRRLFKEKDIESATQYDMIVPSLNNDKTIKELFAGPHNINYLNDAIDILTDINPEYKTVAEEYLNQNVGHWFNMFIMKKELFFEYCELLFGILFKLNKNIKYDKLSLSSQRIPGFLAEVLTGIFVTHKKKTCLVKGVNVVFLSNEKHAFKYISKKFLHGFLSCVTFGKIQERQKRCMQNYKSLLENYTAAHDLIKRFKNKV
jgi:hypothetical protein